MMNYNGAGELTLSTDWLDVSFDNPGDDVFEMPSGLKIRQLQLPT